MTSNIEAIFEPGERVVSMLLLAGTVYVATDRRVYRMRRDPLTDADAFQAVEFHRTAGQKPSSG